MAKEKDENLGLVFGVICNGMVPIKWTMHQQELAKNLPGGLYWSYAYAIGDFNKDKSKNYATQRTEVVKKARTMKAKWLMFIDSDVFVPFDGVQKLMAHNTDIITGVYWKKSHNVEPVMFKEIGNGPMFDFKVEDKPIEIGGSGLGCTLINMKVFDKFDEAGEPYFKQDWLYEENGRKVHVDIGEDHWFFYKAHKLGYKILCDTQVLCEHLDPATDITYPGPDTVRQLVSAYMTGKGMGELVDKNLDALNIDKDKKTIIFYNAQAVPFNGHSVKTKPIAGSETAIIEMAKQMKLLGWNVHVFCNCDRPGVYDEISYYNYNMINEGMIHITEKTGMPDIFLSSRDLRPFNGGRPPVKKTVVWLHDMPNKQETDDWKNAIDNIDRIFFISQYQKHIYNKTFPGIIPDDKSYVTRNGLDESRFIARDTPRQMGRCVYTTTPFRGLDVLFGMWSRIKKLVPHASLHVYSDMSIYNMDNSPEIKSIFEYGRDRLKDLDVFIHKPTTQKELAQSLLSADLMLYPSTFVETSAITCMEGIKAGIPIISTNAGALPETVGKNGVLIDGDPYNAEYQEQFISEAFNILSDDDYRKSFIDTSRDFSWKNVAVEWDKTLCSLLNVKKVNINTGAYWDNKHGVYKNGTDNPAIAKKRFEFLASIIKKDARVGDVGCGLGGFLQYLFDHKTKHVVGMDISSVALVSINDRNYEIAAMKISEEPGLLPIKKADVITCIHTIEHLTDPVKYVSFWKQSLREGGEMILVIPLNDTEYKEHELIYTLDEVDKLVTAIAPRDYEIKTRTLGKMENGRTIREVVVRLFF